MSKLTERDIGYWTEDETTETLAFLLTMVRVENIVRALESALSNDDRGEIGECLLGE